MLALCHRHCLAAAARPAGQDAEGCRAGGCAAGDASHRGRARLPDLVGLRNGRALAHRQCAAVPGAVHAMDRLAEEHGILVTSLLVENFNAGWLIRAVQEVGARFYGLVTFVVITFIFTALGLLEVDIVQKNIASLRNEEAARTILQASTQTAGKFQKYMRVRSEMSVLTGFVVWAFALLAGLELATAWGVIAFVLNYTPFIGPLVATVF